MSSKRTMWTLGLCVTLALALPAVANATITCPSGGGITCSAPPNVNCTANVTSDNFAGGFDCTLGVGVEASCNDPAPGGGSLGLSATHSALDGLPSSCTWSCTDVDETVQCVISDSNSGLPVTLQSFSVE